MGLRPYQTTIVDAARDLMQSGIRSLVIQAPCGAGKTLLCAHMLKSAFDRGHVSWFLTHRKELVDQSSEAFHQVGLPHGIAAAGYAPNKNQRVQVASIQTMGRRYTQYREPKLLVFDEVHHICAGTWSKLYELFPNAFKIGLTATPCRTDRRGLDKYFEEMILGPKVSWLIENGFLSPYRLFAPAGVSVEGVLTRAGDFALDQLAIAADRPSITGDAIHEYKKHCNGKRAIVFCVSVAHSQHVVAQFRAAGISAEHVDGETNRWQRELIIKNFRLGNVQVLSNCELFGEGFNLPAVEAVILLRPTMSAGLYIQQSGRALRTSEGKTHATILDLAGNCQRHGLPDQDREWSLNGNKGARNSAAGPVERCKICPRCYAAQGLGSDSCRYCGAAFIPTPREVEEKEGELVEIDLRKIQLEKKTEQAKAKTLEDLERIGEQRYGAKGKRWAFHVYSARLQKEKTRAEERAEREGNQKVPAGT